MVIACSGASGSTALPDAQPSNCEPPPSARPSPSHRKPRCSIASSRIRRLLKRPHSTASHTSTAPAAELDHAARDLPRRVAGEGGVEPARASLERRDAQHQRQHRGRPPASHRRHRRDGEERDHAVRDGDEHHDDEAPEPGQHEQARGGAGAGRAPTAPTPARHTQPTARATPTGPRVHAVVLAAGRNEAPEHRCHRRRGRRPRATARGREDGVHMAAAQPRSQPAACASSTGARRRAEGPLTRSHLGPAVNRKPEKKSGMKPNVITAACTSEGETA